MKQKKYFAILILSLFVSVLYAKPKPDYELVKDNLKLKVFRKTGNFCLYSLSARGKEKYIPLYDDRSLGRTNKFYVYKDNKVYELKKRISKPVKIEANEDSINIIYDFDESFYVIQKLSFTDKSYGTSGPLLKIETIIENTGGEISEFALKALFDTKLGENRNIPLYTDLRAGIFKETVLEPALEKDSAVISANSDAACLFLINHTGASIPQHIYVANWERLQSIKWQPSIVQGRLFSTKYFHNDSALLFVWPKAALEPLSKMTITMFIGCYDFLRKNIKAEKEPDNKESEITAPQKNIEPESPQDSKDYEKIKALVNKILEIESNPDMASDEYINDLTKQADNALQNIQE
ncbi:hypothetical protein [Treponema denticola]|uniref:hypothetical protein n=1 Tax=Treponema denticola TaxID=158 RepID=UPI0021083B10|nr:hypothetical protein [Treponema denticola]UTY23175.1 hypothetical protein E4N78_02735 [Treponema denticola]